VRSNSSAVIEPFKLERYFARYEFAVPHLLCASDCESLGLGELLALEDGAYERFRRVRLGYTESAGSPSLREAIAALYAGIGPEHVLIHAGAEEAIYAFVRATLSAGDHVVVQVPCYQSLFEVARSQGCDVAPWVSVEADGWAPRFDDLERLVSTRTRAIVINSPHNPTGHAFSADALQALGAFADERGIALFSDEVYRGLELDGEAPPAACELSPNAVSLGVLSKSFGLAGLRIGWIATRNARVRDAVARYKDYLTICNSAPSEFLAEVALRQRSTLLARNRALTGANRALLDAFFARRAGAFAWVRPRAGPIAFPRLTGDEGADAFCDRLVHEAGVLLLPSSCYDWGDRHFRIGFGRANLPEALSRLDAFVD
jgi:aspartate/methionine/tyrosine aminotransferase